jgi:hypothetical protein
MRDEELMSFLEDIESDRVERKESIQEERILAERRRYLDAPEDIQPLRDADIKELDQTLFRETYLPAGDK